MVNIILRFNLSCQPHLNLQQILLKPDITAGPGELGKPVVLPENISSDIQKLIDKGWTDNAFNQYISDMISVERSLPDVRDSR